MNAPASFFENAVPCVSIFDPTFDIPVQHKVDGYKLDHISQYVAGTTFISTNMTPRSNKLARFISEYCNGDMVFFGLQYALIKLVRSWQRDFFDRPKKDVIREYVRRVKFYGGSDNCERGIKAVGDLHDLGYLPLRVKALPEGSRVPMRVPVFVMDNTHPDFPWIVNYSETFISCNTWPMFNAASLSEQYYLNAKRFAEESHAPAHWLAVACHCFAGRGHRGDEDAMMSGMANLLFTIGTDTLWSVDGAEKFYGADVEKQLVGVSVNAFEHATATQRIAFFGSEELALKDALENLYPRGILSYVCDSQDAFGYLNTICRNLKDIILNRQPDSAGLCKFVSRPDSSRKSPLEIICGYRVFEWDGVSGEQEIEDGTNLIIYPGTESWYDFKARKCDAVKIGDKYYDAYAHDDEVSRCLVVDTSAAGEIPELEIRGMLWLLHDVFGGTENDIGLRLLHEKVGIIYGEAITLEMQTLIYRRMIDDGWCVSNVLMGVGSWAFLKDSSRDSYGNALKATSSVVDGVQIDMQKTPKTDTGTKHSAKGLVRVELEDGKYVMYDQQTPEQYEQGELKVKLENGKFYNWNLFEDCRNRLGVYFN